MSESEAEFDGPENQVKLSQDVKMRGAVNLKSSTSAIRLAEIGPRLKLRLVKIEEGICDGEVLYHEFLKKSPEEVQAIREGLKSKKFASHFLLILHNNIFLLSFYFKGRLKKLNKNKKPTG